MKVIILAGGMQSTLVNESEVMPKPMARIGENPILWHIMKNCAAQGYNDFLICGGYKVNDIKDFFMDFYIYQSDITVNLMTNTIKIHKKKTENWNVTVVDTGLTDLPGMRVTQVQEYIEEDDFIVMHGDCLSNISLKELEKTHFLSQKLATIAVAKPTGRFGILPLQADGTLMKEDHVEFKENKSWVNACCKILNKRSIPYLEQASDLGENFFRALAENEQLSTYKHYGFWSPVETKRDYYSMINLWEDNKAPWKIW